MDGSSSDVRVKQRLYSISPLCSPEHIGDRVNQTQKLLIVIAIVAALVIGAAAAVVLTMKKDSLLLATTTSTQDSGLLDYILPVFEDQYDCKVLVVAVGSGEALKMGKDGNADVLMVHSPASEQQFVKDGYGTNRTQIMYNWFVIVGPNDDPAGTKSAKNATDAFHRIYDNGTQGNVKFVSRADDSGTYNKELSLWASVDSTFNKANVTKWDSKWYLQAETGMGAVLDICEEEDAYTLSDDATFYSRVESGLIPHLNITSSGDSKLKNQYSVILVNSTMWPHINKTLAKNFLDWISSKAGQDVIKSYVRYGHQLFTPNAPGYATQSVPASISATAAVNVQAGPGASRVLGRGCAPHGS